MRDSFHTLSNAQDALKNKADQFSPSKAFQSSLLHDGWINSPTQLKFRKSINGLRGFSNNFSKNLYILGNNHIYWCWSKVRIVISEDLYLRSTILSCRELSLVDPLLSWRVLGIDWILQGVTFEDGNSVHKEINDWNVKRTAHKNRVSSTVWTLPPAQHFKEFNEPELEKLSIGLCDITCYTDLSDFFHVSCIVQSNIFQSQTYVECVC